MGLKPSIKLITFALLAVETLDGSSRGDALCSERAPDVPMGDLMYQRRTGDVRCEGFFTAPSAAPSLSIVSFILGSTPPDAVQTVQLAAVVPRQAINVRAVTRAPSPPYEMNAEIAASKGTMVWPLTTVVLRSPMSASQPQLKLSALGLYGWYGEGENRTYVPIRVIDPKTHDENRNERFVLQVRANVKLKSLSWDVTSRPDCAFGQRPTVPAIEAINIDQVITIRLGNPATTCIRITADSAETGRAIPPFIRRTRLR